MVHADKGEIMREVQSPDWFCLDSDKTSWGFHVPYEVRELWATLPLEAQLAIYRLASKVAESWKYP